MTTPDHPDWNSPLAIAAYLAGGTPSSSPGGVPLLRKGTLLAQSAASSVLPGANANLLAPTQIAQVAFEGTLSINLPAGAGTIPFSRLRVVWTDPADLNTLQQRDYWPALGNGPLNQLQYQFGGPAEGEALGVSLLNLDPAQTASYSFYLGQTSHLPPRAWARLQNYVGAAPITYINPGGDTGSNIIAITSPAVPASTTITRLLALLPGKWKISIDNEASPSALTFTLLTPAGVTAAPNSELYSRVVAGSQTLVEEWAAPNCPVVMQLINPATTGTLNPTISITYLDY